MIVRKLGNHTVEWICPSTHFILHRTSTHPSA
jgi:hypothetical protein